MLHELKATYLPQKMSTNKNQSVPNWLETRVNNLLIVSS